MKGKLLIGFSALMMMVALWLAFIWVPMAQDGVVQRIFYFHVGLAWVAGIAFLMVFIWSILYLAKRSHKWDMYASASAEVGLVFTTLVLVTGSIWARPLWGTWWNWEPRLTTTLVLWLIYVAYFLMRSYVPDEERRARFSAVLGIIGFLDVPIVALAIVLMPTLQHPTPLVFERQGLEPEMLFTLLFCVATFTVFYLTLLVQRIHIKKTEDAIKQLKMSQESR